MRKRFFIALNLLLIGVVSINAQNWTREDLTIFTSFDDFEESILDRRDDNVYVINFWATWCGPCVKELPYFEELNNVYKDKKVKVILVSLDFEKHIDKKLIPFLNKKEIESEVVLLLDPKESEWIDKVDPSWSGAIPITIIKKDENSKFYETVFHSVDELKKIIEPHLN